MRPLSGKFVSSPCVSITGTKRKPAPAGRFFVGVLKSAGKVVKVGQGSKEVFEFTPLDTDAPIEKKDAEGNYVPCDVDEDTIVSLFAPTALASALKGAQIGEVVQIEYRGKEFNKKGVEYHAFDVNAMTMEEYKDAIK